MKCEIENYNLTIEIYRKTFGVYPDLENPNTFNEKVCWKKVFDKNPIYTTTTDKYLVREYVSERIGSEYLVDLLQVADSIDYIDFDSLQDDFIIKANHGSGWNKIVRSFYSNKEQTKKDLYLYFSKIIKANYYNIGGEWAYKDVVPKILVERLITDNGSIPKDYKIHCFNGYPLYVEVVSDRFGKLSRDFFDRAWNWIDVRGLNAPNKSQHPDMPERHRDMLEISRSLSVGMGYVRVDLYCVDGKIYFGEMTHYPANGHYNFDPKSFDYHLGKCWRM